MAILKCCVCFSVNFHAKLRRHLHDYESEDRAMPGVEKILSWNETRQNVSFSVATSNLFFFKSGPNPNLGNTKQESLRLDLLCFNSRT